MLHLEKAVTEAQGRTAGAIPRWKNIYYALILVELLRDGRCFLPIPGSNYHNWEENGELIESVKPRFKRCNVPVFFYILLHLYTNKPGQYI